MPKFMQLFGNCNDIFFLGDYRIKGPVDNVVTKTSRCVEILLSGYYLDYLHNSPLKILNRDWFDPGDPNNCYEYADVTLVHNDPTKPEFWGNIKDRYIRFMNFKNTVNNDNQFFVVSLTRYLADDKHQATIEFHKLLYVLHRYNLLNKTIFVQFKKPAPEILARQQKWNCYLNNWKDFENKYGKLLKITIENGSYKKDDITGLSEQFIKKFNTLLHQK